MPNSTGTSVGLVLAAGTASRFGGDKLLAPLRGKPLAAHIADTLRMLDLRHRIAVCPAYSSERAALFAAHGFEIVENPDPSRGMGSSLALGVRCALDLRVDRLLVCLADMPDVTAAHLEELLILAATNEAVVTEAGGVRSPPAVFSARLFPVLAGLEGDEGARHLLRDATALVAPPGMTRDFDTPDDFDLAEGGQPGQ